MSTILETHLTKWKVKGRLLLGLLIACTAAACQGSVLSEPVHISSKSHALRSADIFPTSIADLNAKMSHLSPQHRIQIDIFNEQTKSGLSSSIDDHGWTVIHLPDIDRESFAVKKEAPVIDQYLGIDPSVSLDTAKWNQANNKLSQVIGNGENTHVLGFEIPRSLIPEDGFSGFTQHPYNFVRANGRLQLVPEMVTFKASPDYPVTIKAFLDDWGPQ